MALQRVVRRVPAIPRPDQLGPARRLDLMDAVLLRAAPAHAREGGVVAHEADRGPAALGVEGLRTAPNTRRELSVERIGADIAERSVL